MIEQAPLSGEQRVVLQMIYDGFRERGTWTTFGDVDRPLRKLGLRPERIIASIPRGLLPALQAGRVHPIARDELHLTLKGIEACDGGQEDIASFLSLVPWLAERELDFKPDDGHPEAALRVGANEIREFLQIQDDPAGPISRLREVINLQRWGWSGGDLPSGEWYVQVDRSIYRFAHVETLDDYLEVMAKWEEEDRKPYTTIPDDFYGPVDTFGSTEYISESPADTYVSQITVAAIQEAAAQSNWNSNKLFRLIDELNDSYVSGRAYSAHAMLRALLDHIPPILGCSDFN